MGSVVRRKPRETASVASIVVAAILVAPVASAEVGVPLGPPGTTGAPMVVSIIGDDPDPYGVDWDRTPQPLSGANPLDSLGTWSGDGYPAAVVYPDRGEAILAWIRWIDVFTAMGTHRFAWGIGNTENW